MKLIKLAAASALVLSGVVMSGAALASGGGGGGGSDCGSIQEVRVSGGTLFIPRGGSNLNIMGWGNGTGGTIGSYDGMLEAAAEQCIIVAAASTSQSGSGRDVANVIEQAKRRSEAASNPTVCTSGHSQGGGGSFNAARRVDADCVIAVQPDTVFTVRIDGPVSRDTDVVCIFTTGDTLAPAFPSNGSNCRRNSPGFYAQESGSGTHFAPNSGTGGAPGRIQREYINRWLVN